jgi:ureidoglycolate dehydrogenase (NAD+)
LTITVPNTALESLVRRCFERCGLPAEDAASVAAVLVDANLRGRDSHGIARAPAYMRRVAAGVTGGTDALSETAGAGPLRRIDAASALGPAVAAKATARAAELGHEHGICLVALGGSSHFGSAGYYARRLAADSLIGLVTTNGPANMAPYGSTEAFLGTNALAVGVPLPSGEQFVLDMSCSVAARGGIMRARELGEAIDPGLAIGPDGEATTDPREALAGAVLPLGGPKGTGLALAIGLAAGMLAGASFDDEAGRMHSSDDRPQDLGQIFLAVDPWRLVDRAEAERRVGALIERLHALKPAPGFDEVLYSGERGEMERRLRLESGIPVAARELEAIASVCEELGHTDVGAAARSLMGPQ